MHEAKFTEEIVGAIISQLKDLTKKPKHIKVRVGEMFHLQKESVLMHYGLLTHGTVLDGIAIELEEEPVIVHCRDCGQEAGVEDHHMPLCAHCDSQNVEMIMGSEITAEISEGEG